MSTTAIAIQADTNAAVAAAEASEAKTIACVNMVNSFNNTHATVEERRIFADCVQRLHPEHSAIDPTGIKVLIVFVLLGAAFGAWFIDRGDRYKDITTYFMGGAFGAFGGALFLSAVALLFS